MSDVLMIVGPVDNEAELVHAVARLHPHRVTVLLDDGSKDWSGDSEAAIRDRLAHLLTAIEQDTGASVVGLAGDREQLRGWRFDGVVSVAAPVAA